MRATVDIRIKLTAFLYNEQPPGLVEQIQVRSTGAGILKFIQSAKCFIHPARCNLDKDAGIPSLVLGHVEGMVDTLKKLVAVAVFTGRD